MRPILATLLAVFLLAPVSARAADVFDPGGPVSVISGTPKFTGLTAKSALYLSTTQVLTAVQLTNGQFLIGSTGAVPVASTIAIGALASLTTTVGAGTLTLDAIQDIRTTASPTFNALTLTTSLGVANVTASKAVVAGLVNPTYGASVTITASLGNTFRITATNGTAFTVANPTAATTGQHLTVLVRNTAGGALGVLTWDTLYKLGAAWAQPANGFSRAITFVYDGTNWVELYRGAADVAN
jgi:hypothetical protein